VKLFNFFLLSFFFHLSLILSSYSGKKQVVQTSSILVKPISKTRITPQHTSQKSGSLKNATPKTQDQESMSEVSQEEQPSRYLDITISYPKISQERNEEGTVVVKITAENHHIKNVELVQSSNYETLDREVMRSFCRAKGK
jgi:TonB family protein